MKNIYNESKKTIKKAKLPIVIPILAFSLFIISFTFFTVSLALSLININAKGHISFIADDVYAKVTGTVTGVQEDITLEDLTFDATTQSSSTTPESWNNMKLDFDGNNNIVLSIIIENLSEENSLWFKIVDSISSSNLSLSRAIDNSTVTSFDGTEITTKSSKTATITLKVLNLNESVADDLALKIQLSSSQQELIQDESYYSSLYTFSNYDDTNSTVLLKAKDTSISGAIFAPSHVLHNGKVYAVTTEDGSSSSGGAFRNCTKITSITFGQGFTKLGSSTFYGCSNLTTVNISDSVTTIGIGAFYACKSLESIKLPENLTEISRNLFYDCSSLKSVKIGSKVQAVSTSSFARCNALEAIDVDDENQYFYSNGSNCIIEKATEKLIRGSLKSVIPSSVKIIGERAFQSLPITNIEIPSGVTTIENYAIGSTNIVEITFPSTIETIGKGIIAACENLEKITIDSSNANYYTQNNCLIERSTKKLVSGCQNSIIPSDILTIGEHSFYSMTGLTSVTIPASVTSIGAYAFAYCSSLTSAVFETTTGWETSVAISEDVLSDPAQAATLLNTTYINKVWTRK